MLATVRETVDALCRSADCAGYRNARTSVT